MKEYKAVDNWGKPIITVLAESEKDAKEKIARQLERHGRRGFLQQWREGGEVIEVKPSRYRS